MPKTTAPYVIVYVQATKDAPPAGIICHEICGSEEEAKTRYAELAPRANGEVLVFRSQMAEFRANEAKKKNGAAEVVS